jgi:hypothetical protein
MAIDFPASPTLNDVFTVGNVTYVWDGTKWTASVTGGISLDKIEEGNTSAEVIDTGSDGRFVVTTEGSERLRVTDTGLVGIGTNNPGSRLEIGGDPSYDARVTFNRAPVASNDNVIGELFFQNNADSVALIAVKRESAADDAYIQFATQQTGGGLSERARITSAGRVGIGTSSPVDRLHVDGRIAVSTDSSTPTTGEAFFYKSSTGAVMSGFGATIETGGAGSRQARVSVDSSGRVGIGTTSPAWPLDVNGIAKVKQAVLFEAANSTNRWDLYTNTDDTFRFNYNGAGNDEITITSGGNVGIGTTSPGMKLTINDTTTAQIQLGYNDSIYGRIGRNSSGNYEFSSYENGGNLLFGTTGTTGSTTERVRIDASGRLLVGRSSSDGTFNSAIQIAGNKCCRNTVNF